MKQTVRSLLSWSCLCLIGFTGSGLAQETYEFRFAEELSPEIWATFINVLSSSSVEAGLLESAQDSAAANIIVPQEYLNSAGQANWTNSEWLGTSVASVPIISGANEQWYNRVEGNRRALYSEGSNQPFVILDPTSEIGELVFQMSPTAVPPGEGALEGWAVPIPTESFQKATTGTATMSRDIRQIEPSPWFVATDNLELVRSISDSVKKYGATTLSLTTDPNISEAELAAAFATLSAVGVSVTPTQTAEASTVALDLAPPEILQSGSSSECTDATVASTLDIPETEAVLAFNEVVLENAHATVSKRTQILVVDSGLSENLAEHEDLRAFWRPNLSLAMRQGHFRRQNTGTEPHCAAQHFLAGESAFGFVAFPAGGTCVPIEAVGGLAPIQAEDDEGNYMAGHGGFVAGIAAGGPRLVQSDLDLQRHIGIVHSRIFWEQKVFGTQSMRVNAGTGQVNDAIEYAMTRHFPIMNLSLSISPNRNEDILPRLKLYLEDGLVITSAGNSGSSLSSNSRSFPASAASSLEGDARAHLIVVGGVTYDPDATPNYAEWEISSYSRSLVDVLAPAQEIPSFDLHGNVACHSGTSFAAPQVAFTAGMLMSTIDMAPDAVRDRIMDTAQLHQSLEGRAQEGRVLDIAAALDVFVDLIWLKGWHAPIRGRLINSSDSAASPMLKVCNPIEANEPLFGTSGILDVNRLHLWKNHHDGMAIVKGEGFVAGLECPFDASQVLKFHRIGASGPEIIRLEDISRLVPSRFRESFIYH